MNIECYQILALLADGCFHSGEKIAKLLEITRASVCKRIAKLNEYLLSADSHLVINTMVGKGYCLNTAFNCINLDLLQEQLSDKTSLDFIPVLDSTNTFLQNKKIECDKYYICIAEQQQKGRGRNTITKQKGWVSPFGNNIYCSVAWQYPGNQNALIGLSLVAGITVAEVLSSFGISGVRLKWPNDIYINNAKVAGILTESYGEANGCCKIILGFGINIHDNYTEQQLQQLSSGIIKPWISLAKATTSQQSLCRNLVIIELVKRFLENYELFIAKGLDDFLYKWQHYDLLNNCDVRIDVAGTVQEGKYLGIDQQGALLVKAQGKTRTFYSGEVSLRVVDDSIN